MNSSTSAAPQPPTTSLDHPLRTAVLAWLTMLGVDLALHAGVLAPAYDWTSPFLLTPEQAFLRIPAGYLTFLILAVGLTWLLPRCGVRGGVEGARLGAAVGAVLWGALLLGMWSISTASPLLLGAWWLGQSVQLAAGGYMVGAALGGQTARRLALWAVAALVTGLVVAIALQSSGYAPAPSVLTRST